MTDERVTQAIYQIKLKQEVLDAEDSDIASIVREIENLLRALRLGVSFSIDLPNAEGSVSFEFVKRAQASPIWRLMRTKDEIKRPLLDCPRNDRFIFVSDLVPALLLAAADALEEAIQQRIVARKRGYFIVEQLRNLLNQTDPANDPTRRVT